MDILRNLRRLESRLAKKVNETAQKMTPSKPREPLEIVHAIVETVEKHIEPAGRGRYVFPFNQIRIRIAADSSLTRARFEAVFESEPSVQQRIIKTLETGSPRGPGVISEIVYPSKQSALQENRAAFFFRLERELEKVNSFYSRVCLINLGTTSRNVSIPCSGP